MTKRCFLWALLLFNSLPALAEQAGPWDLDQLFETPKWENTEAATQAGYQSILFQSLPYKGKSVEVFAYYAAPNGKVPEGGWPAVVCVHGGGGTAFHQWVNHWNDHGYAAISMDLEGNLPIPEDGTKGRRPRQSTPNPGPSRQGVFGDYAKPLNEQWYTHAVAQVILANSLIRSMPEVNPDKVGVTGVSWGGTITSTVMGVDKRFAFAIPVYGCGFLAGSDGHQGRALKNKEQVEHVNQHFDGSAYFDNATCPVFWVNGTNDNHFTMPITQRSADTVKGPATIYYGYEMGHGHSVAWRIKEIYAFADSVVKDAKPLHTIGTPEQHNNIATAKASPTNKIDSPTLYYTKDALSPWPERKWLRKTAKLAKGQIYAKIPEGTAALYFAGTDERGLNITSRFIEIKR